MKKITGFIFCCNLLAFTQTAFSQRKISLKAPKFSEKDILGANAGIRPYRKGGLNLDKQKIHEVLIYNNYGHGGAGASLAYGSVKHVLNKFLEDKHPHQNLAVLGSGYMGLITANELADRAYKVTVYADLFPESKVQIKKPCLTSLIAGGFWMPFGIDVQNKTLHEEITKHSFDYYKSAIEEKTFRGLKFAKVYLMEEDEPSLPTSLAKAEKVEIEFGNHHYFPAFEFTTILLDGYVFLNELVEKAKEKGVVFVNRHFNTEDDLLALDEKILFNCLGYGSKALLHDENLVAVRGQHIYLKPQVGIDYFLFSHQASGRVMSLYPSESKIASGFSYETNEEEAIVREEFHEQFKKELQEFFVDKIPNPLDLEQEKNSQLVEDL